MSSQKAVGWTARIKEQAEEDGVHGGSFNWGVIWLNDGAGNQLSRLHLMHSSSPHLTNRKLASPPTFIVRKLKQNYLQQRDSQLSGGYIAKGG